MHWYDWALIIILLIFVYKRAEGYTTTGTQPTYSYNGQIDSYNVSGGRPAEIFSNLSPSEWQEKDVSYVHRLNKVSCDY